MIPNRPRSDHDRLLDSGSAGARRLTRWHPYAHSPAAQNAAGSYSFSAQSSQSTSPTNSLPTATPLNQAKPATYVRREALSSVFRAPRSSLTASSSSSARPAASLEFVPVARAEPGLTAPRSALPAAAELTSEAKTTSARCLVERAMNLLSSAWKAVEANPLRACTQSQTPAIAVAATSADSSHPAAHLPDSSAQSAYDAMLYPYQSSSQHMPLNFFIHEVLRRSRTNFVTLQTSLCYLEVVAAKLPALVKEEAELLLARQSQNQMDDFNAMPDAPHMPSPLLCPRRTFLAALLLASKFLQDRSYSNKAWAKLTGLPAREVGRCERALFATLEWRLWVGKDQPESEAIDGLDNTAVIAIDAQYVPPSQRDSLAPLRKARSEAVLVAQPDIAPGRRLRAHSTAPIAVPVTISASASSSNDSYVSPTSVAGPSNWMDVVLNPSAGSPTASSAADGYDTSSQHSLSPGALSYTQSTASDEYSDVATPDDMSYYGADVASPTAGSSAPVDISHDVIAKAAAVLAGSVPQPVGVSGWS